jgi:uncharacterized membrane protein
MARHDDLTTLVVGYDDVDVALTDFHDLENVRREHRVGDYEAAVVRRLDDGQHDLVETSVEGSHRRTLVYAGLGAVLGVLISPAIAVVACGAGIGVIAGRISEEFDALDHADLREVQRVVADSPVTLIVIAQQATLDDIANAASARGRASVPFSDADIDLLERELRKATTYGRE